MGLLDGKAVVITGSGRGIGAACAMGAARQGASVVVNDLDKSADRTVQAIVAAGGRAIACIADVGKSEEAERLIAACLSTFGKIDGLVNNAGQYHLAPINDYDAEAARLLVEANVLGPLNCTGHAVKPMLAQGRGSIVNVVSGALMGMPRLSIYGATKGAVASMIYTGAIELAATGVRINGLSPIAVDTRMSASSRNDPDMGKKIPDGQRAAANSPVVEYLLSDLSAHVNGQILRLNNGEFQLYAHPAFLAPSVTRDHWTAEAISDVMDREFAERLMPCGL